MKPTLLFRKFNFCKQEIEIAKKYFNVVESRVNLPNQQVIGRYCVVPFYHELQRDLIIQNSSLINSILEHQYIANFDYYEDVKQFTPKSYFELKDVPKDGGPFFIKGRTNSKKHLGFNKVVAQNYEELTKLYFEHLADEQINQQGIVIREFIKLKTLSQGIDGFPFTNEWRLFFYKDQLVDYGYYWSNSDIIPDKTELTIDGINFAKKIAKIISDKTNFFVVDIAQKESREWTLIEINDGQQSGLSEIDPDDFYRNLSKLF